MYACRYVYSLYIYVCVCLFIYIYIFIYLFIVAIEKYRTVNKSQNTVKRTAYGLSCLPSVPARAGLCQDPAKRMPAAWPRGHSSDPLAFKRVRQRKLHADMCCSSICFRIFCSFKLPSQNSSFLVWLCNPMSLWDNVLV